jgi:pimeloyl-ACP methyl ester carboxylesterase
VRRIAGTEPHVPRQALEAQVTGMVPRSRGEPYPRRRTCPVLSFYAGPSRAAAERAVFADDRSRVVTWEGAGHWLHQERPAEFTALVSDWLEPIVRAAG